MIRYTHKSTNNYNCLMWVCIYRTWPMAQFSPTLKFNKALWNRSSLLEKLTITIHTLVIGVRTLVFLV